MLDQIDQVLKIKVISVALNQLFAELFLQELLQFVWVDEAQGKQGHLSQEEDEEAEGVELEEPHVFSQGTNAAGEADDEDDPTNDDKKKSNVEHNIEDRFQLEGLTSVVLI